jgi:hypothetical protein
MTWAVTAVAAGTAILGAVNADAQRKAQQKANQQSADISAAQMEYSPWTHVNPQAAQVTPVTGNALGGALEGGLGGAMFASAMKKNAAEKPTTPSTPAGTTPAPTVASQPLGPSVTTPYADPFAAEAEKEKMKQGLMNQNPLLGGRGSNARYGMNS